ncbi:hypothetical protein KYK30_31735 [Shinella yambaruensis]|uniref:Tip attachment protein J domain-containing protein n=1 Tax=Shinella yambaruensis TaxID=415996 RepID=A0ABQ5ZSK3_9HYPH|nr:hypothetical protein [Shinella yambaruensis]MCJ8030005.1 hypothetical protein [Shinella yambaruensis]MCU7984297.1 hypothetical protein [Shinella yambaruensis]GLR55125.1 hypothetical protein GCM10007923_63460 [Shinella yambaruensis]
MPQAIVGFLFTPAFAASFAGSLLTSAVGLGLSMGLQFIAQELFGQKQRKPEDIQGLFRQSVGPRSRHYGRVKVGGYVVFIETKNGSLYQLIVHGQGPITGYHETYIDNRLVELQSGYAGGVVTPPYNPGSQIIDTHFGWPGVSGWGRLNTDFPSIWSPAHKLEGLAASLLYTASVDQDDITKVYPNRIPLLHRVIDGAGCYDPRSGTSPWTRNAALIMRDYLTHPDGMQIPGWLIDEASFATAANVCDEAVPIKGGGTIPRYAIGLTYSFDEEPRAVLSRIINACDGRLYITSAGKVGFDAGKWVAPVVTISDADGHIISASLRDSSGPFRETNEVIVKFTHVEVGYKEATSDPWRDEASISQLGEVRSNVLNAYEIQHHNHARRIAKIVQKRASPRWQGSITCTLHALNAWDQRWINLVLPDYEIDGTFEILGTPALDTESMTVTLQVASFEASTYDFNATLEEGTGPTVPEALVEETIPVPTGVWTNTPQRDLGDIDYETPEGWEKTPMRVYVAAIHWDPAPRGGLQADAQYSLNGGVDWLGMAVADGGRDAETGPMNRGVVIKQRVRWRTVGGAVSDWVNGADVTIPG